MPFLPFVYEYPSSSPRAHCTPNKSVLTLRYTRRHGLYKGPCPKALTECSPLDFRRSSILHVFSSSSVCLSVKDAVCLLAQGPYRAMFSLHLSAHNPNSKQWFTTYFLQQQVPESGVRSVPIIATAPRPPPVTSVLGRECGEGGAAEGGAGLVTCFRSIPLGAALGSRHVPSPGLPTSVVHVTSGCYLTRLGKRASEREGEREREMGGGGGRMRGGNERERERWGVRER